MEDWHSGWPGLNDELRLALSQEALRRASETLAQQADLLADEMELGNLLDRGGPAALRLFAAVVRSTHPSAAPLAGFRVGTLAAPPAGNA